MGNFRSTEIWSKEFTKHTDTLEDVRSIRSSQKKRIETNIELLISECGFRILISEFGLRVERIGQGRELFPGKKNNEEQIFFTAKYAQIAKGGEDFTENNEEQL